MKHYLSFLILFISLILTFSIFSKFSVGVTLIDGGGDFSIQKGTTININKEFDVSQDYEEISLDNLVSLGISGSVTLNNVDSYARVILKDKAGNEYLVYEASYPLYQVNTLIQFTDLCEETCILNQVSYGSLRIELSNAKITIKSLKYETNSNNIGITAQQISETREERNSHQKDEIIRKLNERTDKKWVAGVTSVSHLSYQEKKELFGGQLPNLYGFEYYIGGIFDIPSSQTIIPAQETSSSTLPAYFDWRYRHGAGNPNSPYYDGDKINGWLTTVKSQDLIIGQTSDGRDIIRQCGSCWAFSAAGTVEALINLYYNQHLDVNLSEQDLVSCSGAEVGSCNGGHTDLALQFIKDSGIVDEACFPYKASDETCENCTDWQQRVWKISSMGGVEHNSDVTQYQDNVKTTLIQKGPLDMDAGWWGHTIVLVGYGTLHEGDIITTPDVDGEEIQINPEDVGKTYWIIKNSWGAWGVIDREYGKTGYGKLLIPPEKFYRTSFYYWVEQPIPPPGQSYNVICVDADRDGYCNWGIGPNKPSDCPPCSDKEDCDDSNSKLGPFTNDLNCMLGDVDNNCRVDMKDIALVSKNFGKNFWDAFPEDVNHDCSVNDTDMTFCVNAKIKFNQHEWWSLSDSEKRCDFNKDYIIDIGDIVNIGTYIGKSTLDWKIDLNNDCKIDMKDIAIVAKNFEKFCEV